MYYSLLLMLADKFDNASIEKLDCYFASLSPSAKKIITVSKISDAMGWDYPMSASIVSGCVEIGLLHKKFALQCPNCGTFLLTGTCILDVRDIDSFCPLCDKMITADEFDLGRDIIVMYSLDAASPGFPFVPGQPTSHIYENINTSSVAPVDSLAESYRFRLITFSDLYSPSDNTYRILEDMLENTKGSHATTTKIGQSLEDFVSYWFCQCAVFKSTTHHRTSTNQIDTLVRVNALVDAPFFCHIGSSFYVECKNENTTPSISYLQKFHSILHSAHMTFGIMVTKEPEPCTYKDAVNRIFLIDRIAIVRISVGEIQNILQQRKNLLEVLDLKYAEIQTDSRYPLGIDGLELFNA